MSGSEPAKNGGEILDFGSAVSGFMLLGDAGRLTSLSGFLVSRDFKTVAPKMVTADLGVLAPFIVGTHPSPLVLVLHPTERAQSYFLVDSTVGGQRRRMKVFQDAEEIILSSIDEGQLPVIELTDLKTAVLLSRKNHTPIALRIRYLELRENLQENWQQHIKAIFEINIHTGPSKPELVQDRVAVLARAVRSTMFNRYLAHCLWMDPGSGLVGSVTASRTHDNDERYGFQPFLGGDAQMHDFLDCIDKDDRGHLIAREAYANIYPIPLSGHEWTSPTLHFYDEEFRDRYGFDEYYSLYRGLSALSAVGAPVLIYDREQVDKVIPVRVLKPSLKRGGLVTASVAQFAARKVVWQKKVS